ncbi:hypothetical protein M011DRAFT_81972 [Sporormia fimetaria CBS 119925]|uniref:Uncharacterized protein n=1 Tax=Sporormia fimetaria CBS 119925 TaxID=1340428 RepID=A0A6A6VA99_9PLEO|nr:hypothetical protein M011DRAFT_81972 [Sporormia fimetaria CBS 119925]
MSVPEPIYALNGHCSVVHENTLYVYSSAGFQSLALQEGAEWEALPMDVSLTGAQCVKVVPGGNADAAMLYVVGGSVNETAAAWDYPGLMHYSFSQKKWDWLRPETFVTQNRQNHAAIYIPKADSILVYSGSQITGDLGPSTQTFLISLQAPFRVRSTPAADAPPSVRPLLVPWDDDDAAMLGGGPQNNAVYLFNAETGWKNLGVPLAAPLTNQDAEQCIIVSGQDGSKVLERYDLGANPNKVSRIQLLNPGGTIAAPGTAVGRRQLTVSAWPTYNATLAPTVTRTGFSIAEADNGLAVITGGNPTEPLSIFNQTENSWVNATQFFAGEQVVIKTLPTSSVTSDSSAMTSTSTAAPTSSAGATLGAIFGIAAILILLLFCLKYRKAKKKKEQQSGYIEKDRLSFADRGAEFMKEAGGSIAPHYSSRNGSQDSLAIVSGRSTAAHKRGLGALGSDASTAGLVKKGSPLGYSEPLELEKLDLKPEPVEIVRQNSGRLPAKAAATVSRSRSSGWSKYFTNNEATNLAHMPSQRSTYGSDRTSTGSQSMYTDSRMVSQAVAPLQIPKFENQRVSKVVTGSPTLGHSQENLPAQPMKAELGRANSNGSMSSHNSQNAYYANAPVETWTPVGANERPPSSTYTNSIVGENQLRDGTSSYYADGTSSYYAHSNYSSFYPGQPSLGVPEVRASTATVFPGADGSASAPSQQTAPAFQLPPRLGVPAGRESTVTVFPHGVPEGQGKGEGQDMSWLNLGAGK